MGELLENERKSRAGSSSSSGSGSGGEGQFSMISLEEASAMFPGFRFSPTDHELICYYLKKKLIQGSDHCVQLIPEVDICRHEPWDLPGLSVIQSNNEWFFFSPRGRKYPNGSQSKRATESGYWKATGKERPVKSVNSKVIGTKRTLVFHTGRAPKGKRTEWIMHEYCTTDKSQDAMVVCRLRKNNGNGNFHFTTPRRDSSLAVNNSPTNLSTSVEQSNTTLEGGTNMSDSCSKESSNSYNSNSEEHVYACSESDENIHKRSYAEEEDCYADIMEDNIIELDDCSLNSTNDQLLPISAIKFKSSQGRAAMGSMPPFQGTANRRLRLRIRQRLEPESGIYDLGKESRPLSSRLIQRIRIPEIKLPFGFLFLIMLTLLLLCKCPVVRGWFAGQEKTSPYLPDENFEWRQQLVSDVDTNPRDSQKQQQISNREEVVKEKIIMSQEKNIQRLNELVRSLRGQLQQCRRSNNETLNGSSSLNSLTENVIELEQQQILED
ncbi:hypothetical protein RD792_003087 [Penstemon davidsonii]|uniref:NAC domain-containing protein n=1 Tax=Penstemon davidsonii TaxID=160366 RepID=A0ABR0DTB9_9LAMI|nr:hypothetical protein RD792_003087 [Penstemon davidsonii]